MKNRVCNISIHCHSIHGDYNWVSITRNEGTSVFFKEHSYFNVSRASTLRLAQVVRTRRGWTTPYHNGWIWQPLS